MGGGEVRRPVPSSGTWVEDSDGNELYTREVPILLISFVRYEIPQT